MDISEEFNEKSWADIRNCEGNEKMISKYCTNWNKRVEWPRQERTSIGYPSKHIRIIRCVAIPMKTFRDFLAKFSPRLHEDHKINLLTEHFLG